MTAMLHSIDVGADGGVYIATLGGNLPPQMDSRSIAGTRKFLALR